MRKFVDNRVTVVIDRDEQGISSWSAVITMRFNEVTRVKAGQVVELSSFSKRLSGSCRIKTDWKLAFQSSTTSDPVATVQTNGEGPLFLDGRDLMSEDQMDRLG